MAPHSSTLAWKIPWTEEPGRLQSMGSLRVRHDWATSLSLFTFHFYAWEKEMATHSSILAWRIPRTEEPSGLPSMGSHRVRHDWSDLAVAKSNLQDYMPARMVIWRTGINLGHGTVGPLECKQKWSTLCPSRSFENHSVLQPFLPPFAMTVSHPDRHCSF